MKAKYESKRPYSLTLADPDGIVIGEWSFTSELNAYFETEEVLDLLNDDIKEKQGDAKTRK